MSPVKVLFVCTANICRSPYMELYARAQLPAGAEVTFGSAGTHGFHERAMDPPMRKQLESRGVDGGGFLSRRLTAKIVESADLVLTAELDHRAFIVAEHPAHFRRVYTLGQFVDAVSAQASPLTGRELVTELTGTGARSRGSDDVLDPYGRGSRAAARCAEQVSRMLDLALPALSATGGQSQVSGPTPLPPPHV